ncbi:MAG: DUF4169 family protein, partial [Pseudomonadota bacterium]
PTGRGERRQTGRDMGDIVNLRGERKRRERIRKATKAAENRVRFGKTKAEKDRLAAEIERDSAAHDGRRLDREPDDR